MARAVWEHPAIAIALAMAACKGSVTAPKLLAGGGAGGMNTAQCTDTAVRLTGLRRTTAQEYRDTVSVAFPGIGAFDGLPRDDDTLGPQIASAYLGVAQALSTQLAASATTLLAPCDLGASGETACVNQFAARVLPILERRSVTDAEVTQVVANSFQAARATDDLPTSLRALVEYMLQVPDFLYRAQAS